MVRHVVIDGPGHDLQTTAVERKRNAVCVRHPGTCRMQVIHIYASPNDLNKLFKRVAPLWKPGFIGCQIARDNVQGRSWHWVSTEIPAATQVGRGIDLRRALVKKIGVSTRREFGSGASGMTAIAVCMCVDNVAA